MHMDTCNLLNVITDSSNPDAPNPQKRLLALPTIPFRLARPLQRLRRERLHARTLCGVEERDEVAEEGHRQ